ncbi:MAG TPA: hypothetical protein VJA19_03275 [Pseudomonas sp.]|nr:hypothetical protein [Pseudomonas sp.]
MSDFTSVMNEMRDHHKSAIGQNGVQRFMPSSGKLQTFLGGARRGSVSKEVNEVLAKLKLKAQSLAQDECISIRNGLISAAEDFKKSTGDAAAVGHFQQALEKQRAAAKQGVSQSIDILYDEAISLGEQYPQAQGSLMGLLDQVGEMLCDMLMRLSGFIGEFGDRIVESIGDTWEWLKEFWGNIFSRICSWF